MHTQNSFTPHTAQAGAPGHPIAGGSRTDAHEPRTWQARPRKHVTDLLDDADALADWHRNLDRLRNTDLS
ncbi:MAG: hypothetical protein ABTQ28_19175 [Thauera sp.]|jgi:hypothetical protein